jgi:hypothetical protein
MTSMAPNDDEKTIQSFEVTRGQASGDLLSERHGDKRLRVGVLACAYFEYWRMYEGLQHRPGGARLPRDV